LKDKRKALELEAAGKRYQDIADALECSRATAYRLTYSAQQKLKTRMKAAARAWKP
jgi:DNA-binding CsgD family transcriptional regulator